MHSTRKYFWAAILMMPLLLGTVVFGDELDDTIPEVTARVARISFIRGGVQIRRVGSQEWELAVLNLPIVEGDEITTDAGGRFEIQFNSQTHVRVAENSYLKIAGLKDEGIALSLPEGILTARLTAFDKDRTFFEVDAPKTTIAVQKAGMYRVDAGKEGEGQVRVTVADKGEARVYTENSGFTLKNGRTAKLNIAGDLAGEWETGDAAQFADEFDSWSLERDAVIAKLLRDAHYEKYYDRDIYGAEDLSDYGDWVYTKKYGYAWRPHRSSVSKYSDWSPYRYGHWRWVPPYGWTWVNDEPWGWATYHHGRWIHDNGGWYWTPYGQYRNRRSWWSPALVGVTIVNNNICWYPLPHNYGYYNYNYYYGNYYGGHRNGGGNNWGNNNGNNGNGNTTPTPTPTPAPATAPQIGPNAFSSREQKHAWMRTPPLLRVPPSGVVSTPLSSFGRDKRGFRPATDSDAKAVLSTALGKQETPIRMLPTYNDLDSKVSREIRSDKPRGIIATAQTGASDRKPGASLDQRLQQIRIFGDRQPSITKSDETPVRNGEAAPETRKTGAVKRTIISRSDDEPIRSAPSDTKPAGRRDEEPIRAAPTYTEREKPQRQPVRPEPSYDAPQKQPEERQREPVKPQRNDPPPTRSEPPPPRNEPSPTKNAPDKPNPPVISNRKGKDG